MHGAVRRIRSNGAHGTVLAVFAARYTVPDLQQNPEDDGRYAAQGYALRSHAYHCWWQYNVRRRSTCCEAGGGEPLP